MGKWLIGVLWVGSVLGTGLGVWAICHKKPVQIPPTATFPVTVPLTPVRPETTQVKVQDRLAIDTLTDKMLAAQTKVGALQKILAWERERLDSCFKAAGLPQTFVAVCDTIPHQKDSVVIDLRLMTATFFPMKLISPVGVVQNPLAGLLGGRQSFLYFEAGIWSDKALEASGSVRLPQKWGFPAPDRIGAGARTDGLKKVTLGWGAF